MVLLITFFLKTMEILNFKIKRYARLFDYRESFVGRLYVALIEFFCLLNKNSNFIIQNTNILMHILSFVS